MVYFTSDNHFGHTNVIKYCGRPFRCSQHLTTPNEMFLPCEACTARMDKEMIRRWNERVGPSDKVFHLGDFSMGCPKERIPRILDRLNGYKILIRGNHDRSKGFMLNSGFDEVHNNLLIDFIEMNGEYAQYKEAGPARPVAASHLRMYMSHIPLTVAPEKDELREKYDRALLKNTPPYYDYFLCGHVHEAWRRKKNVINVGVDVWDFRPVTLKELISISGEKVV